MAAFSRPQGLLPMLFALLVFLQATAALHAVHGSPQAMKAHMEKTKRAIEERQVQTGWLGGKYIQIQGVNPGSPAERLEIRDLQKNADMWNLYLLGMERFKNKSKQDKVGYFQIAGV
jgi:tyrosinase